MDYSEFINIVKKYTSLESKNKLQDITESDFRYSYKKKNSMDEADFFFYNEEYTGGITGGSCWDSSDSVHSHYTNESGAIDAIKGFDEIFDNILTETCPNITFIQYKNIYNDVIKTATRTEYEYYGNTSDYLCVYCEVHQMYEALVQKELIWGNRDII